MIAGQAILGSSMETDDVLVIDLFAGPGGLGEGFASCENASGRYPFKIGVSVEKEPSAHKTLTTRAFYRKIKDRPEGLSAYFSYLNNKITRQELFSLYPNEAKEAELETLGAPRALGEDNRLIHKRIKELVSAHRGAKLVIGGPPCQAYSLAGRSRNAGIKGYSAENDHRNFLYLEYLKVLSIAQPDVFVMENVKGILSAKIDGKEIFAQILEDLSNPGRVTKMKKVPNYRIYSLVTESENPQDPKYNKSSDFLIRAENYGIPQARHRVILLGVRNDIDGVPSILAKFNDQVTVEQVLGDLPPLRSGFSKRSDDQREWEKLIASNAVRLPKLLSNVFDKRNIKNLDLNPAKNLERRQCRRDPSIKFKMPSYLKEWYLLNEPGCVLNHETRGHMESDLLRYAFSAAYTKLSGGVSPKARDYPNALAPDHENWLSGSHSDRFRAQAGNKCATTVTSHISKDGHYFIHYDPTQCRSLTVREAARLQTFPDNYLFEGNRTQQYVQVGNAVPPYLATQIAEVVKEVLGKMLSI